MAPNQCPDDVALAQLRNDFPGHRIWRSARLDGRLGDWVASLHDPAAGIDPTVICSDATALRSALEEERQQAAVRNEDR
ncbi:hypothetical protein DZF91_04950 [Actinomadura logoneensis]|uniref:Uncharacterized protein n=1 Tax=Actinomadura logoneensis TaxID=2293572 RepID=A0A372JRX0_9ACTN|nr:hypothetical protein [Actinomadura logoneensis]RFU42761.1 hypothetical protein DZF91_04950 [Actinomadura logoneensis]